MRVSLPQVHSHITTLIHGQFARTDFLKKCPKYAVVATVFDHLAVMWCHAV